MFSVSMTDISASLFGFGALSSNRLRHALAEEATQHHTRFLVPETVAPDMLEAAKGSIDNIAGVLGRCADAVPVKGISGIWRSFNESGNVAAILMRNAQLSHRSSELHNQMLATHSHSSL